MRWLVGIVVVLVLLLAVAVAAVAFAPATVLARWIESQPDSTMRFDDVRGTVWKGGAGQVWMLRPPARISREGWTIEKQRTPRQAVPGADVGTGILGKWKYAPNLDAFVALQDPNAGNVWIYKPVGWRNPSP